MSQITFKGNPVQTEGTLPSVGSNAPAFKLVNTELKEITLNDFKGKRVVLNIFPSIDTGICAASARKFNELASSMENTVILNVSKDLPFAHNRFCAAEGLKNVHGASEFKDHEFSKSYGVDMIDGPLSGLMSRAVVIIDESGVVKYTEQVPEIAQEPNYESAMKAL